METRKKPLLTKGRKIFGCGAMVFVWLVGTLLLTLSSWSILPVARQALHLEGGWVNFALITSFLASFAVSGFITLVGMVGFAGAVLVLMMTYAFFSMRKKAR